MTVFGATARLERCQLSGNADGGVVIGAKGAPVVEACAFYDHATGKACGVLVEASSRGRAAVGADCVFARNAKGGVVRK